MTAAIPPILVTPLAGWLSDTFTAKVPAVIGFTLTIPTLLLLRIPTGSGAADTYQEILICTFVTLMSTDLTINELTWRFRIEFCTDAVSFRDLTHLEGRRESTASSSLRPLQCRIFERVSRRSVMGRVPRQGKRMGRVGDVSHGGGGSWNPTSFNMDGGSVEMEERVKR